MIRYPGLGASNPHDFRRTFAVVSGGLLGGYVGKKMGFQLPMALLGALLGLSFVSQDVINGLS